MKLLDIIFGFIMIPIGIVLFLCVAAFATVLWLPYIIWSFISNVLMLRIDDEFIEFIFICYGFAIMCLIAPFEIIESSIKINK